MSEVEEYTEQRSDFDWKTLLVLLIIGFALFCFIAVVMVNRPMGTSHRISCMNNQHEIWTAVQIYDNRKMRYPGWRSKLAGRQVPWTVELMPYLGMNDQYSMWADEKSQPTTPGISTYVCSSDERETPGGPWLSYVVNCGLPDSPENEQLVDSPAAGLFFDNVVTDANPEPLFTNSSNVLKKDGTAQTLGMGENLRVLHWTGFAPGTKTVSEYLVGFNWQPPKPHYLEYPVNQRDVAGERITTPATNYNAARLNSPHGNVVIVTFADGHIFPLSDKIDQQVYNKLCTPDGMELGQKALKSEEYLK